MAAEEFRLLIVDDLHPILMDRLRLFPQVVIDYQPKIAAEDIADAMRNAHGLVIRTKTPITSSMLAASPKLRWVARAGAGLDNIDEAAAAALDIALFNAPEGNRDAVGEHVIGMLLSLFNKLNTAHTEVSQGIWQREANRGIELKGKTVGLIGYGNNGHATAQKLSGFGVKVLAYDKYLSGYGDVYATEAGMERLFESCDILSLHLPLTTESRAMVDANFIGRFEKPVFLINAARGELVRLKDLKAALDSGQVLGACLDVLENEKLSQFTPEEKSLLTDLAHSGKVLFSPHVAGWTVESYRKISEVLAGKIEAWFGAAL